MYTAGRVANVEFSKDFGKKRYKLLEVPADLLPKLEASSELFLKGAGSEAVLCTQNQTFALKRVEISNSVFIVPPNQDSLCISSLCEDFYELKPTAGKLDALTSLVQAPTQAHDVQRISFEVLHNEVMASEGEISDALKQRHFVRDGADYLCMSREGFHNGLIALMTQVAAAGWPSTQINERECVETAVDFSAYGIRYLLLSLAQQQSDGVWALNESGGVAAACLEALLFLHPRISVNRLYLEFAALAPRDWKWTQELLQLLLPGLGVRVGDEVVYLPAKLLPAGARERLEALYSLKSVYEVSELLSYVEEEVILAQLIRQEGNLYRMP